MVAVTVFVMISWPMSTLRNFFVGLCYVYSFTFACYSCRFIFLDVDVVVVAVFLPK